MSRALELQSPKFLVRANAPELTLPRAENRMRLVLDLVRENVAAGGGPFAAAVFEYASGRLLAAGANPLVASGCSCAHAEIVALPLAQRRLRHNDRGAPSFPPCERVGSAEPCRKCPRIVLWSGVRGLSFGTRSADVTAQGFDGRRPETRGLGRRAAPPRHRCPCGRAARRGAKSCSPIGSRWPNLQRPQRCLTRLRSVR